METFFGVTGDFTILKFVKDLSRDEIEDRCGFERGRLDEGAVLAVLAPDETLGPDEFALGASTRWSRSSAAAPWAPAYVIDPVKGTMAADAIEAALQARGVSPAESRVKVARFFALGGDNRPAKVLPRRHRHGDLYPDADGVGLPQFKLLVGKTFVAYRRILGRSGAV